MKKSSSEMQDEITLMDKAIFDKIDLGVYGSKGLDKNILEKYSKNTLSWFIVYLLEQLKKHHSDIWCYIIRKKISLLAEAGYEIMQDQKKTKQVNTETPDVT